MSNYISIYICIYIFIYPFICYLNKIRKHAPAAVVTAMYISNTRSGCSRYIRARLPTIM